ncbi:MAG: hypothetical protein IJW14_04420 [Oscillospiraceae bacterium]|nr:hypothetical protein [Oscillospiraceae bacterium]
MRKNSDNFSMQDAMRLAQSEAGQQLFAMLRAQNGDAVDQAMAQAASGDYSQIKQTLAGLLSSPQVQTMLEQLGRQSNE